MRSPGVVDERTLMPASRRPPVNSGACGLQSQVAPIAQLAEAADLKSVKSGFESQWGHQYIEVEGFSRRKDQPVNPLTRRYPGAQRDGGSGAGELANSGKLPSAGVYAHLYADDHSDAMAALGAMEAAPSYGANVVPLHG
jgi:hypothetical protein